MKNLYFIILLLFSLQCYSQKEINNNTIDVIIDGSRKIGFDCSYTVGKFCEKSIRMMDNDEEKNDSSGYGKLFIDDMDTLKLSIEKNTFSLEDILNLFKDNIYTIDSDFHLSPEILYNLDIDPDFVIPKGNYYVNDSENNDEVIITFTPVIYQQKNSYEKPAEEIEEKKSSNFINEKQK